MSEGAVIGDSTPLKNHNYNHNNNNNNNSNNNNNNDSATVRQYILKIIMTAATKTTKSPSYACCVCVWMGKINNSFP
jgi:hypothetical protein